MICYKNTEEFHIGEPTALSLGKFDGVHRGHEELLARLMHDKRQGLKAAVYL